MSASIKKKKKKEKENKKKQITDLNNPKYDCGGKCKEGSSSV